MYGEAIEVISRDALARPGATSASGGSPVVTDADVS
jgi:hypothetical protein